jgi:hypothetical protein
MRFGSLATNGLQIGTVADFKSTNFQKSTRFNSSNICLIYNNLRYCAYLLLATGRSSDCVSGQTSSLASLGISADMCDLLMCLAAKRRFE